MAAPLAPRALPSYRARAERGRGLFGTFSAAVPLALYNSFGISRSRALVRAESGRHRICSNSSKHAVREEVRQLQRARRSFAWIARRARGGFLMDTDRSRRRRELVTIWALALLA